MLRLALFILTFTWFHTITCLTIVNYGAFTKSAAYAVAQNLGFFTHYNLNVTYIQVPNSTVAYDTLATGGYDVLSAAIDNIVNRRFNSNLTFTALGQTDSGLGLVLAARPNITSVLQLKGKPLMVDSPISGYAYALQKIMATYGLRLNRDYYFQVSWFF